MHYGPCNIVCKYLYLQVAYADNEITCIYMYTWCILVPEHVHVYVSSKTSLPANIFLFILLYDHFSRARSFLLFSRSRNISLGPGSKHILTNTHLWQEVNGSNSCLRSKVNVRHIVPLPKVQGNHHMCGQIMTASKRFILERETIACKCSYGDVQACYTRTFTTLCI